MILRFRFSNFGSFRDAAELSMVASTDAKERAADLIHVDGMAEAVLPACAIYGANASGKSTVLRALQFLATTIVGSHRQWEPDGGVPLQPFKGQFPRPESEFVTDFVMEGIRYQYGFRATVGEITAEWLHSYPHSRRQELFVREQGNSIRFSRNLPGENSQTASLMRPNSLFISVAAQNNHPILMKVYQWFGRSLYFIDSPSRGPTLPTMKMCAADETREQMASMLRAVDVGVTAIDYSEEAVDVNRVNRTYTFADLMKLGAREDRTPVIRLVHQFGEQAVPFDLADESRGTLAFVGLMGPVLRTLESGGVLAVDELDASLHPYLSARVLALFNTRETNPKGAQLLFNTHDTHLLTTDHLRRDQLWFTEKDAQGVSHLYPLTDFKPRKDENLELGYLKGRYGAIPSVGFIPRLFEEQGPK